MSLSVNDPVLDAWFAIAPPLHFAADLAATGADPRPKHLALAEHDEFRPPSEIVAAVGDWQATTIEIVPGASHFFIGRTDRLVAVATVLVDDLVSGRS